MDSRHYSRQHDRHDNAVGTRCPGTGTRHPGTGSRSSDAQVQELLELEPVAFDAARIKQQTFEKLGLSAQAASGRKGEGARGDAQSGAPQDGTRRTVRRIPRRLAVILVAAALMLVAVPSAFAVGTLIASMGEGGIGFFADAGSSSEELNRPTFFAPMQADLEKANAPIGQTLAFDGGSITLDTLAVDDNFINAFFTIRYDEPVGEYAGNAAPNGFPQWGTLQPLVPRIDCLVDGTSILAASTTSGGGDFEEDPYFIDERSIGVMLHKLIPGQLPDVFDLEITLPTGLTTLGSSGEYRSVEVNGSFAVTVDKSATAALTRSVAPGVYRFETVEGVQELTIEKLSAGPFGAVAVIQTTSDNVVPFAITDDKGNTASFQLRGDHVSGDTWDEPAAPSALVTLAYELVGLDPQAQSLTITPVIGEREPGEPDAGAFVATSYDFSQLGTRVPFSDIGGATVVGYEIEQGRVTVRLEPYGFIGLTTTEWFYPDLDQEDALKLANGGQGLGLRTQWYDRASGQIVRTTDYYAATDEQLAQYPDYRVMFQNGLSLAGDAALTLPLG